MRGNVAARPTTGEDLFYFRAGTSYGVAVVFPLCGRGRRHDVSPGASPARRTPFRAHRGGAAVAPADGSDLDVENRETGGLPFPRAQTTVAAAVAVCP